MKLNIAKIDDNRRLVLGEVVSITPSASGKVVEVGLKGNVWNPEDGVEEEQVLKINFWNNDTVKMADRITAAKVAVGSIIMVEIYEKEGNINGNDFKYKGHWVIPATDTAKERNIFMGSVTMYDDPDGRYVKLSVPVDGRNGEEATWHSITCWNNEGSPLADRAKKLLYEKDGKKAKAVLICGANKPYNERPSYSCYEIVALPRSIS